MPKLHRRSPLSGLGPTRSFKGAAFNLVEETNLGLLKITSRGLSNRDLEELGRGLNLVVPTDTNKYMAGDDIDVACLGPGEWLLHFDHEQITSLEKSVAKLLCGKTVLVCDLSDGRCVFRISGAGAAGVLSSLMPIDFYAIPETGSWCATTLFAEIGVFVARKDDASTFRIIVDQSFANYAWSMLTGADGQDDALQTD